MLNTLRTHAQSWVIKLILGVIVLTFVISFGIGTFSSTKEVLAKLDRQEILVRDYNKRYQEEFERLRRQFPGNADKLAQQFNLRKQVLEQMINRELMLREARRQHFAVGDQDVQDSVRSEAAFQANGRFDFETYRTILRNNGLTPEGYEYRMREDLLLQKYQRNLLAGVTVSQSELEQRFRMEHEKIELEYAYFDPERFRSKTEATPEEVKAYYDSHATEFMTPDRFQLRYAVLTLAELQKSVRLPDRAAERYYERHVEDEFTTPVRVHARHILKRVDPKATDEQKQAARKAIAALLAEIRGGKDFAEVAKAQSEDLTKDKGGDLGWFKKGDMVPAFEEAALALAAGQVSDIVSSPFGLHIIQVLEKEAGRTKSLDTVKGEIEARLLEERAGQKLTLEADRLPQRIQKEGLDAVAGTLGLTAKETGWFDEGSTVEGLGSVKPLHDQIRTLQSGDAGAWRRNPVLGHVLYQVTGKQPATLRPFDEVKELGQVKVLAQKRVAAAEAAAKAAADSVKTEADFRRVAGEYGLSIGTGAVSARETRIAGVGDDPEFFKAALQLAEAKPFARSNHNGRGYLLHLRKRYLPDVKNVDNEKQQLAGRLKREWEQYFLEKEYERLRSGSSIEILRPEFVAGLQ
jgi:peptidyl-prolyl cis-trans isomerase D